ncbi:MAG: type II toxin-antitoxin system VapC family toxin [Opitutales bacterium]
MELIVCCRNKTELAALETFLADFTSVHVGLEASRAAVDLLKTFRPSHNLRIDDALIAASVLTAEAFLLSKNQRDYRFIPGLKLLPYPRPR